MSSYPVETTRAIVSSQETVADTALAVDDFTGVSTVQMNAALRVRVFVNTNAIRIRYDGTAPTTAIGAVISGEYVVEGTENIRNLQIIRDNAASAEVYIILEA